jgi:hypothetical protein
MKYGLAYTTTKGEPEWLRESNKTISVWDSVKEANDWRKKHIYFSEKYIVKQVTPAIIKSDWAYKNETTPST